jgi:hypothetical protein
MPLVAGTEPRDEATPGESRQRRQLERAPSERYAVGGSNGRDAGGDGSEAEGSALAGPLLLATLVSLAGAGALVLVGAILASTLGLLFISGAIGAATGLILAGAAAPRGGARPVARQTVTALALALTLGAIGVAFVATWLYARSEGGTLGLVDYLFTTFGPFVPGELVIGAVAAAWGASAGPVQR